MAVGVVPLCEVLVIGYVAETAEDIIVDSSIFNVVGNSVRRWGKPSVLPCFCVFVFS